MSESAAVLRDAKLAYRDGGIVEAEALCRRLLRRHPTSAGALHLLGMLHAARGDAAEAVRLYAQSLAYSPEQSEVWCDLATAYQQCGMSTKAIGVLVRAISIYPRRYRAYGLLGALYYQLGRIGDAADLYREWFRRDPTNVEVHHMVLSTRAGSDSPPRCSDAFVRAHFDNCADVFDERLIKRLGYRGHQIVAGAYKRSTLTLRGGVLDAGCGTGLCGPLVRPYCGHLVGVDLSENMIERARARGVYDELIVGELCAFMASRPDAFAAIIAADVLIYFGTLEPVMKAAYRALQPEGILAVTFELLAGSGPQSYRLEVHGRYCHTEAYVRNVLSQAGFESLHIRQETIRLELGKEAIGIVAVARKVS